MRLTFLLFALLLSFVSQSQEKFLTEFEKSGGKQTPTYHEIIKWWQKLDQQSGKVKMLEMGMTDAGYPLHLVVVANNGDYNFNSIRKNNKRVILINNGIHPGEPDGIDASMLLVRDIVTNKFKIPDNIVLAIIPVYNIGGCLNRSENYRVDQNGPDEFGFRGNSQNYDLNRDFIKCDSKDARAFTSIFHLTDPDVFVDNHVSNGADYQHVMTLLTTQHNKLGGKMGEYMEKNFEPSLYAAMKRKGYDLVPYVNVWGDVPENGWQQFFDSPRYSSGFAALWHSFSFTPETHMLKPYPVRVKATYALMQCFIEFTAANSEEIKKLRDQQRTAALNATELPVRWTWDKEQYKLIDFKGYEHGYKTSLVSNLPRLFYDTTKPYEMKIKLFNHYKPSVMVKRPIAYIIPQGWWKVTELLQLNKVKMRRLTRDTIVEVEQYYIDDYKSSMRPFEGHHLNSDVKLEKSVVKRQFRKGDWYIPMNQAANRFLMEVLEPESMDSYFAWNFFDPILGQKEGFSDYVFEDKAAEYLAQNAELKSRLEERRKTDTTFAKSARAQLGFVFQNSPWYEPDHLRYPVYRVL